ncbi:MAG: DUF3108 domain-containing protein [Kiloniellaceae bacterium]
MAAAGLLAGAFLFAANTARAEAVSAHYQVYFGGFHVLDAQALWQSSASDYRLAAEAETQGFIGWLNPWKGTTQSDGRIAGDRIIPRHHENWGTTTEESEESTVELTYDRAGDLTRTRVQPEQDFEGRVPLPDDAGKGTLDPMSVIAGLSELLRKSGRCEGTFAVFDGRKRYDLMVSDAGETDLEASDYSIYAGPARGCRLDYKMLGGHKKERNKYVETVRERIVWVARPADGAPLIPVRLKIETAYGTLMGHLTGFARGPQVAQKLAE